MSPKELTTDEFLQLVVRGRDAYVEQHRFSNVTGAAVVLIDQFVDDVRRLQLREPATFLRRNKLETKVRALPGYGNLGDRSQNTWNSIGNDLGRELSAFQYEVREYGRSWRVTFAGPTGTFGVAGKVGSLAVKAIVADQSALPVSVREEMRIAEAADLIGRCLCCDKEYEYNLDQRLCTADTCGAARPRSGDGDRDLYVSILPERRANYSRAMSPRDRDRLFAAVDNELNGSSDLDPSSQRAGPARDNDGPVPLADLVPYTHDHLARAGLALGKPLIYRVPRLGDWAGFRDVFVLDLSTYRWSNTLKDPKSWATINVAIAAGVSNLALYTAGNAGTSVAKMAYAINGSVKTRLKIYALIDADVGIELETALQAWGAHLVSLPAEGRRLIDPKTLWSRIASETGMAMPEPQDRWHVTDGWDGVGIVMYRLLFREVVRRLQPEYIVLPVGTGSLFVGAHLGLKDAFGANYATRLIGAVPAGKNILSSQQAQLSSSATDRAIAPKLIGDYTPLEPCVSHIVNRGARVIDVSSAMQTAALRHMEDAAGHTIAAEPSAAIAFGALFGDGRRLGLHEIARSIEDPTLGSGRDFFSTSRVLVVNSGFGMLSHDEAEYMRGTRNHP